MLILFDFRCEGSGETFERLADRGVSHVRCKCGHEAKRLISPVKCQLEGASGDFPGAHMKWVREHESRGANN